VSSSALTLGDLFALSTKFTILVRVACVRHLIWLSGLLLHALPCELLLEWLRRHSIVLGVLAITPALGKVLTVGAKLANLVCKATLIVVLLWLGLDHIWRVGLLHVLRLHLLGPEADPLSALSVEMSTVWVDAPTWFLRVPARLGSLTLHGFSLGASSEGLLLRLGPLEGLLKRLHLI